MFTWLSKLLRPSTAPSFAEMSSAPITPLDYDWMRKHPNLQDKCLTYHIAIDIIRSPDKETLRQRIHREHCGHCKEIYKACEVLKPRA